MNIFHAPTVLWKRTPVVCTSRMISPNWVDITLTKSGVVIEKKTFLSVRAAADFAIDRLNTYGVSRENT